MSSNGMNETAASMEARRKASEMGLRVTSTYRSPAENAAVGGMKGSAHTKGLALDVAGSTSDMAAFARWAKASGLFETVLWRTPGHFDHVHIDWSANGPAPTAGASLPEQNGVTGYLSTISFTVIRASVLLILAIFGIMFLFSAFPVVESVVKSAGKHTVKNLKNQAKGVAPAE